MGFFKCHWCGVEVPNFDVAHVCSSGPHAVKMPEIIVESSPVVTVERKQPEKIPMWKLGIMIHGYRLLQTCGACPEQYDVFDDLGQQVAYFRLRHGSFRVDVPDCGGETIYTANPKGDGVFYEDERVHYLTEAVLAVQEYYINRRWNKEDDWS
jgi:hypothetical protein